MAKSLRARFIIITAALFFMTSCGSNQGDETGQTAAGAGNAESGNNMDMTSMAGMSQMSGDIEDQIGQTLTSERGLFRVTVNPEQQPVPLNAMHNWKIHVETSSGQSVDNAEITVAGGMPAHDHGMPTVPQVTQSLGNGDYLAEGMQFQMPGHWQVDLTVDAEGQQDDVSFDMNLQP